MFKNEINKIVNDVAGTLILIVEDEKELMINLKTFIKDNVASILDFNEITNMSLEDIYNNIDYSKIIDIIKDAGYNVVNVRLKDDLIIIK